MKKKNKNKLMFKDFVISKNLPNTGLFLDSRFESTKQIFETVYKHFNDRKIKIYAEMNISWRKSNGVYWTLYDDKELNEPFVSISAKRHKHDITNNLVKFEDYFSIKPDCKKRGIYHSNNFNI